MARGARSDVHRLPSAATAKLTPWADVAIITLTADYLFLRGVFVMSHAIEGPKRRLFRRELAYRLLEIDRQVKELHAHYAFAMIESEATQIRSICNGIVGLSARVDRE
jgi:hypothetical protein